MCNLAGSRGVAGECQSVHGCCKAPSAPPAPEQHVIWGEWELPAENVDVLVHYFGKAPQVSETLVCMTSHSHTNIDRVSLLAGMLSMRGA